MKIKSFRGKIAHEGIDTITLHTNTGSTGYKITKFEIIPATPGAIAQETVCKIFKIPQTGTPDGTIDFSDNTLIAAGYLLNHLTATDNPAYMYTLFDNETFNQDIYITHSEVKNSEEINYYIELETVNLSLDENTVATLKDIRNIKSNPQ